MRYYNIFIVLAILSVLLMTINRNYNYLINDWYISGVYVLMWVFLFLYTVSKVPKKKKGLQQMAAASLMAETVGFEPTDGFTRQTISSRSRYDRFDTSPCCIFNALRISARLRIKRRNRRQSVEKP